MNLRHLLILLLSIYLPSTAIFAQFDAKLDPVAAIISKNIKGGIEVGVTEIFSIDVDGIYSNSASLPFKNINFNAAKSFGFRVMGKFYPYSSYTTDGLYIAPYFKYRNSKSPLYKHTRFALGLMSGYKKVWSNRFYFEFGTGLGRRVHSTLRDSTGDYLDGLTGTNFFGSIYDFFADSVGKYDLTTRVSFGYRLQGQTRPKKVKEKPMAFY